jgi:hypothetical protein
MSYAEQIFEATVFVSHRNNGTFTRDQVRQQIGLSRNIWESGYTAIFQGMRDDHPGGAPDPSPKFRNLFYRIEHGKYQLCKDGERLASKLGT